MRSSHNRKSYFANQVVNNLINAAEICDPVLINEFFSLTIDANLEHLNLISENMSLPELMHRQRVISQGTLLLSMFNHFATRQVENGLGELSIPSA